MVILEITISLDGYVAGPKPTLEQPLGEGGMALHQWLVATEAWRRQHGQEGGEAGPDSELVAAGVAGVGATVMGRRMFSGGSGPWAADPNAGGWWGDDPPFGYPVFVLTHHAREPLVLGETTFSFVGAFDEAFERARAAAGERNVAVAGGASVAQQALRAGLVDEMQLHVAPILLGGGTPLFENVGPLELELLRVIDSPRASHLRYRVSR